MSEDQLTLPGFGSTAQSEWPTPPAPNERMADVLKKDSETHTRVLEYLKQRLEFSERKMATFYPRWRVGEAKVQAYLDLPDYDKFLKDLNNNKAPPQVVNISIPHAFATISTIVTYLLHTFCGRKPMLQVGSYKEEMTDKARNMEMVLQYNADHTRLIKQIAKFLHSTQVYGVGVMRVGWTNKHAKRTKRTMQSKWNIFGISIGEKMFSQRQMQLVYSGNEVAFIDPFMFFPDPRVPMHEVNRTGEFVFWRNYVGKHTMKQKEIDGIYFQIDRVTTQMPKASQGVQGEGSQRSLLSNGDATAGFGDRGQDQMKMTPYYQEDQGTCVIIPRELGLGESEKPEKWLFTLMNKDTIVQAEPFDADHDMHPVAVAEPYTMGQSFGSPSMMDFLGPLQDMISWLVNSHMYNIRASLNNMFVVDPSMVEMQDLKNPEPGKLIRLKRAAYGQDVRTIVNQLSVADVTRGHMGDMELFIRISQQMSSVTDNLLGMQDAGGRKTATEVRTTGEAAASRLAAQARIISTHGMVDCAEMMSVNIQQYIDEAFYVSLAGVKGAKDGVKITPDQLNGDFYYPIHDGTLPLDRVAMLDVWKEIFMAVAKDQELRQQFSIGEIFSYVAELGGAKNIDQFKNSMAPGIGHNGGPQMSVEPRPTQEIANGVQAGNVVPISQLRQAAAASGAGPLAF